MSLPAYIFLEPPSNNGAFGSGWGMGINVRNPPYNALDAQDSTPAFRAAIAAATPQNQNSAQPLITRMVALTITTDGATTATATLVVPFSAYGASWFANGMTVNINGFTPAALNGNGIVVNTVTANSFKYTVASGTGAATGFGYIDIPAGPAPTGTSLAGDGVTLTITMTQPLPAWILIPNSNAPTLDPGSAIQLAGFSTVNNVNINSAAGTWYTVQSIPANNQFTILIPPGSGGVSVLGTVQSYGILPYALADSGLINTPIPVLVTSTSKLSYGSALIVPPGNYYIQRQTKDAPNTPILMLFQVSMFGAGEWNTTFSVRNSPGTAITATATRPMPGVPAIDLQSHQVGQRVTGFTINWLTNGATFTSGTALGVSGGLSAVQGAAIRAASVAPVISGGVITSVTILDGGEGYVSNPTITQYNAGSGTSFAVTVTSGAVTAVVPSGGSGAVVAGQHVIWANCDGIRMNQGVELDHVIITSFDAGLVFNSFGGGLQIHDVVVQACYYGFYFFMDGGNDQIRDVECTGHAMACFAWHNNTVPEPTHHTVNSPNALSMVFRRIYAGTSPIGMFAETGFTTAQPWILESEFHDFGFELVNLAAVYAADAALNGSAFPGFTNIKFTHPFTANFWTRLGPGALPQLGAGANLAQNFMAVLGFVSGYLDVTHDWGWGPGNIAAYHIIGVASGTLSVITVTTLANVDTTRWFMIDTDANPNGMVRYNLHGQASYGSGTIPSGTANNAAVAITVAHNTGYVRQQFTGAPQDFTRIFVTATNRGGLSLPFDLFVDPVGSVAQSALQTVFHVTCNATPTDPNLVSGNLPANLTFNWIAM